MKSNYKKIGKYIREVNKRDTSMKVALLLGVSIEKKFKPSIANIIGTDMSTYKIVERNQFAYGPVTSRNGDKISIALLEDFDEAIVSQAYTPFEITDTNQLLPEYLMMWFRRPEFDRYARFMSHGSAREIFGWEEMCNTELPVPSIEKQKEIVREYNIIVNRIKLNDQLCQKLEETAQTIYKHWFIDFEFPNEEGRPYKSNGGEMVESELGDVPKGWEIGKLNDVIELIISHRGKSKSIMELNTKNTKYIYPVISAMNVSGGFIVKHNTIRYADVKTFNNWMSEPLAIGDVIMTSEAPMGELLFIAKRVKYILSQRLFAIRVNKMKCRGVFMYFWLQTAIAKEDMKGRATGTTVSGIKLSELKKVILLQPYLNVIENFENKIQSIMELLEGKRNENEELDEFKHLLLAKLATIEN